MLVNQASMDPYTPDQFRCLTYCDGKSSDFNSTVKQACFLACTDGSHFKDPDFAKNIQSCQGMCYKKYRLSHIEENFNFLTR